MKVLHINTASTGGAAIAAIRIHEALLENNIDSNLLTLYPSKKNIKNHFVFKGKSLKKSVEYPVLTLKNWIIEKFSKRYQLQKALENETDLYRKKMITPEVIDGVASFGLFSFPDSNFDVTELEIYKQADIIHLHWIAGFIDYELFFKKNKKPVVWTLHDANPFLGGFHHTDDELRNEKTHRVIDKKIKEIKYNAINNCRKIVVVSPSNWLANEAKKSKIFSNRRVVTIRNCISHDIFKQNDKVFSRKLLNLDLNKKIFLLASNDLKDFRKGIDLVLPIIESPLFKDFLFLLVGSNFEKLNLDNIVALNNINDELLMSVVYSASDFFILPSRLDNLPNTMLESIACGTPVISFPIGDTDELLVNSRCGIVTKKISTESLLELLKDENLEEKFNKDNLINFSQKIFSSRVVSENYISEYKKILSE